MLTLLLIAFVVAVGWALVQFCKYVFKSVQVVGRAKKQLFVRRNHGRLVPNEDLKRQSSGVVPSMG